jgi:hypothetical protein
MSKELSSVAPARRGDPVERLRRIHELQAELVSSPWVHDVIELSMAVAVSTPIADMDKAALLWLIVSGNPSGGKTSAVANIRGRQIIAVDTLTENALASGYVPAKGELKQPDLLTQVESTGAKCLIIKDLSSLFSRKDERVKTVLGELTNIYDGEFNKATGTVGVLTHEARFAIIACVTPLTLEKHQRYMAQIGQRFLMYHVPALTTAEVEDGITLVWGAAGRDGKLSELRQLCSDHVAAILAVPPGAVSRLVTITPEHRDSLNRLSKLLSRGRAIVEWERPEPNEAPEIVAEQIEEPFRALEQIRTLAHALAVVHGRQEVTGHDIELVRRVVLSSMPRGRAVSLAAVGAHPEGVSVAECATAIGKGATRAKEYLSELERLGLVIKVKCEPGGGRPPFAYQAAAEFADLLAPVGTLNHIGDLTGDFSRNTSPKLTTHNNAPQPGSTRVRGDSPKKSPPGCRNAGNGPRSRPQSLAPNGPADAH